MTAATLLIGVILFQITLDDPDVGRAAEPNRSPEDATVLGRFGWPRMLELHLHQRRLASDHQRHRFEADGQAELLGGGFPTVAA